MGPAGRSPALVLLGLLLLAVSAARGSPDGGSVLRLPSSAPRHLAPRFPRSAAVDLIRALNLHPADASPRPATAGGAPAPAGTLVERPIHLASLAAEGTSVKDLGHHAGYYRLPNTHDAR
jgi:vitellogenic carboxypeptidase-like protein/serine carboxypeptidase-like clade 4